MKKKIVLGMLIVLSLLVLAVPAFALTEGEWEFQLLDDEVTITGYLGEGGTVVVPSTLYGVTVTKVELSYDKDFENVTSLEYPGTVKEIKKNGVGPNLRDLILNEGTEIIADEAFGRFTFENLATNLTSVHLPSTITTIEGYAFANTPLSTINFHSGIKKIGQRAFVGTALTEVDLTAVSEDCEYGWEIFSECQALETVKFNPAMTETPDNCFADCSLLKNVTLPKNLQKIGERTFYDCASLEEIILPTSLKTIGKQPFFGTALKEVTVPYGVTEIDSGAFSDNEHLKSLYIPDTVVNIHGYYNLIENSPNCIVYCSQDSYAAEYCKKNSVSYLTDKSVNSGITVLYNGTRISFHKYDQNPELINSRTLVPLRAVFEAMDAEVTWDGATGTAIATRDGITVKIQIGANEMDKNGQSIPVDVPAQILNDRTMVPIRVIAEAFGADVQWNDAGRTVLITE